MHECARRVLVLVRLVYSLLQRFTDAQVTHAILQDIRTLLKSVQSMMRFFVVLTIIGLIGSVRFDTPKPKSPIAVTPLAALKPSEPT
jgi:hypothetical protein